MNSEEYLDLKQAMETMFAVQAGQTALLMALIQTHPRYEDLQMATTNALELMLSTAAQGTMSDETKEKARTFVENLQQVKAAAPGAPGTKARSVIPKP